MNSPGDSPSFDFSKIIQPDFFAALGNPMRWQVVQMLASGDALPASEVAAQLKRDFDGVSKHLRVMRAAGVLTSHRCPVDGRLERYSIPKFVRVEPGVLDYGFCRLQVPGAKMFVAKD